MIDAVKTDKNVIPFPEPSDLEKAMNVDFETERNECKALGGKLKKISDTVSVIKANTLADSKTAFNDTMEKYIVEAKDLLKDVESQVEEASKQFLSMLTFYHAVPKRGKMEDVKPGEIFTSWHSIAEEFRRSWKLDLKKIQGERIRQAKVVEELKKTIKVVCTFL